MPPRPKATNEEILIITLGFIAEHDISGVTVDMIATKAGVSKATIYRRWPSRDALILDAISYTSRPETNPDTGSLRSDLTFLLEELVDFLNQPDGGKVFSAFLNAAVRTPALSELSSKNLNKARRAYKKVIDRAIKRGELPATTNAQLMIDILISPFLCKTLVTHKKPRKSNIQSVIDVALTAFGI